MERRPKSEFMRKEGYPLYLKAGHEMLNTVENCEPLPPHEDAIRRSLNYREGHEPDQGAIGLYLATAPLREYIKKMDPEEFIDWQSKKAIHEAKSSGAAIFQDGLEDLHFPFQFAPILAVNIFRYCQEDLGITNEKRRSLQLTDYAAILETEWFQTMLRQCAFTDNGVWGNFGNFSPDYPEKSRANIVEPRTKLESPYPDNPFQTTWGEDGAQISLNPSFERKMTALLQDRDSVGCPVAPLSRQMDADDPNAQHLIRGGHVELENRPSGAEVGRQTHSNGLIGRSASVLAEYLQRFEERYGQPYIAENCELQYR